MSGLAPHGTLGAIARSLDLLSSRDRWRYWAVVAAQCVIAVFDLVGVLLIGVVAALAVAAIQGSSAPPPLVSDVLARFGVEEADAGHLMLVVTLLAAVLLTTKSLVSMSLIKRQYAFLADQQERISDSLAERLFSSPLDFIVQRSSQETAYALMEGVSQATVVLLGAIAVALAEGTLLIIISMVLLILYPWTTLVAACLLTGVAVIIHKVLGARAGVAGTEIQEATVRGLAAIQETLDSFREITVLGRRLLSRRRVQRHVRTIAGAQARLLFTSQVPKYVFETALILGVLMLLLLQSTVADTAQAITMAALFLAAGSRVMPSLLRLQSSLITANNAASRAAPTYRMATIVEANPLELLDREGAALAVFASSGYEGFDSTIDVADVSYSYSNSAELAIRDVTFGVAAGESLAIVGPTGAGKSTLADLILGVVNPASGSVRISGVTPAEAVARWPGAVAYVPQAVGLHAGTVRENVALELPRDDTDDERIWSVLEQARLADLLRDSREGLDTLVGERGLALSGGQRQRLGIARALYSSPLVLVMDEATSALDAETEAAIAAVISELSRKVTVITIAHRLATVRSSSMVLYLDVGCAVASGTFEEVRRAVPAFDHQARLLGL